MTKSEIQKSLDDAGLDLNDVRWYLAVETALVLQSKNNEPQDLIREIWSGELEARLYRMEEKWLDDLASRNKGEGCEEAQLNEYIAEIRASKRRRYQK